MSELPDSIVAFEPPRPRDSASAVLVRHGSEGGLRVLLGLRSRKSRFMPGHLAFPGGGMEQVDGRGRPGDPVDDAAFEKCVVRELREETGIDVPVGAWVGAGERITPPMFPVRFRTKFFVGMLPDAVDEEPAPTTGENEALRLVAPSAVIAEWESGKARIPPPVLPILRCLAEAEGEDLDELARRVAETNAREQRAPRIEFVRDVWMLPVRTATLPPATHTNVWMPGRSSFVIVDPGSTEPAENARLLEVVERRSRLGHQPLAVLLTHYHRDHVGGAAAIANALKLPLRAHPTVLQQVPGDVQDVRPLHDRESLDLDGMTLTAVETPGHAPGHFAFHLIEPKLLIAGDLVSGLSTILIDPDHGDMGAFLESLERADGLGCRMLLPGHGPPLPATELRRVIAHRREREAAVLAQLVAGPVDLDAIALSVYADVPRMPLSITRRQTLAHLLLLERNGRVRRDEPCGPDGPWLTA